MKGKTMEPTIFNQKFNREGYVRNLICEHQGISHKEIMDKLIEQGVCEKDEKENVTYIQHKTNTSSLFGLLKTNLKKNGKILKVTIIEGEKHYEIDEDPNRPPQELQPKKKIKKVDKPLTQQIVEEEENKESV